MPVGVTIILRKLKTPKNNCGFVCKVVQKLISLHTVLSKYQKNKQKIYRDVKDLSNHR